MDSLDGEELVQIAGSEGHCAAVSLGGDCFTWGDNTYCQLGLRSTLAASTLPPSSSSSEPESDSDSDADILGDDAAQSARGPLSRKPNGNRPKRPGVSRGPASSSKPKIQSPPKKLNRVQLQRMRDTRKHVPTSQLVDLPVGEYAQQVSPPTSAHSSSHVIDHPDLITHMYAHSDHDPLLDLRWPSARTTRCALPAAAAYFPGVRLRYSNDTDTNECSFTRAYTHV